MKGGKFRGSRSSFTSTKFSEKLFHFRNVLSVLCENKLKDRCYHQSVNSVFRILSGIFSPLFQFWHTRELQVFLSDNLRCILFHGNLLVTLCGIIQLLFAYSKFLNRKERACFVFVSRIVSKKNHKTSVNVDRGCTILILGYPKRK